MREQKIIYINLKNGEKLVIPSANISHVESIGRDACRVYYGEGKSVDIKRDIDWMVKHLAKDYDRSDADEY